MLHKNAKKKPLGCGFLNCGTTGIRTWDTRIFNPLLYQLSYGTRKRCANIRHFCLSSFEGPGECRPWEMMGGCGQIHQCSDTYNHYHFILAFLGTVQETFYEGFIHRHRHVI